MSSRQKTEKLILECINDGLLYKALLEFHKDEPSIDISDLEKINRFKKFTAPRAIPMIEEYNKIILSDEIKDMVVNDCKEALMKRTRLDKWIEGGIIVMTVVLAIIFALMTTTQFDPKVFEIARYSIETVRTLSALALILAIVQLIFYLTLKF